MNFLYYLSLIPKSQSRRVRTITGSSAYVSILFFSAPSSVKPSKTFYSAYESRAIIQLQSITKHCIIMSCHVITQTGM